MVLYVSVLALTFDQNCLKKCFYITWQWFGWRFG